MSPGRAARAFADGAGRAGGRCGARERGWLESAGKVQCGEVWRGGASFHKAMTI